MLSTTALAILLRYKDLNADGDVLNIMDPPTKGRIQKGLNKNSQNTRKILPRGQDQIAWLCLLVYGVCMTCIADGQGVKTDLIMHNSTFIEHTVR